MGLTQLWSSLNVSVEPGTWIQTQKLLSGQYSSTSRPLWVQTQIHHFWQTWKFNYVFQEFVSNVHKLVHCESSHFNPKKASRFAQGCKRVEFGWINGLALPKLNYFRFWITKSIPTPGLVRDCGPRFGLSISRRQTLVRYFMGHVLWVF